MVKETSIKTTFGRWHLSGLISKITHSFIVVVDGCECCIFQSDHYWFCEICEDGGDLMLCDNCPRSFHQECLKLEDVPDGEWKCPKCVSEMYHISFFSFIGSGGPS